MKKISKKVMSFILCTLLAFTAIPLTNYIDYIGEHKHNHHLELPYHNHSHELGVCSENYDHDHKDAHDNEQGFFGTLFSKLFPSAKAAACPHNRLSSLYSDAAHPHATFYDCRDCLSRLYTGSTTYKSNCATCNPALNCKHTGSTWQSPGHPHQIYCQTCSANLGNGYNSNCSTCNPCALGHSYGSPSYSSTHPHNGYAYCTRGCGASNSVGSTTISTCITCNPCANGHQRLSPQYCDAEHPHANFVDCRDCLTRIFTGGTTYKSNCSVCNPDLVCLHTAETWTEPGHPHRIVCRGCSAQLAPASYRSACTSCNPTGGSSGGSSTITIHAATSLTSVSDSGVLSIEYAKTIDDSFSYWAVVSGGDTLKSITCTGPARADNGVVNLKGNESLGTYTITATTSKGATRTISVTVKTQSAAIGDIRFRTIGMNIKKIANVDGYLKNVSSYITMEGASIIPQSEFAKIAGLIGKYDGKTYTINGSLVIEVFNVRSGKVLGTYDVLAEFGALTAAFAWGQSTISDFRTMQNASISYQAPKEVSATAVFCSQDKGTVFGSLTAQQLGAPQFVFPYETYSTVFSSGMISAPAGWDYHGAQWLYNPQGDGYTNGSGVGQSAISVTFTSKTPVCSFYFYWKQTTGSITVLAVDASTDAGIGNATVSLGGSSGSNGTTFNNLAYGTYSASASAPGYYSSSGSATISATNSNAVITIPLTKIPTYGNLNVTVRNRLTDAVIPNAMVSCAGSNKMSNNSGVSSFTNILPGTHSITASAGSGFSTASVNTTVVAGSTSSVTIYLDPAISMDIHTNIQGSGQFRKGSTVIVAASFTADQDIVPTKPAKVTLEATYRKTSGSGYVLTPITSQAKDVIVPHGETNLVWFELTLPSSGYYSDNITFHFTINPPEGMLGEPQTCSETVNVLNPVIRSSPQTKFERTAPSSYLRLNRKNKTAPTINWTVWEWQNGSYVNKQYSASLTSLATIKPDATAGFSSYNTLSGKWTTRSGYGLNTELTVSAPNLAYMIAGSAKADCFYPEYNYSTSASSSDNLVSEGNKIFGGTVQFKFSFPIDQNSISKNKMHKTPVWYPDGEYTVNYQIFDIWTPGGELTATDYATVLISGNMYDDSYVSPIGG